MGLTKNQADKLYVNKGEANGSYVETPAQLAALETDANWASVPYAAGFGLRSQKAVSLSKMYFYECIADGQWVRYSIGAPAEVYLGSSVAHLTAKASLEDESNWTNGAYTGTSITGTLRGQSHYDANFKYEAVSDNLWIRTVRQ